MGMNRERVFGILRHVLTTAGGIVVARGDLDEPLVEPIVGGLMAAAGFLWSIFAPEKR